MVKVLLLFGKPRDQVGFDNYFEQTHRPLLSKLPDLEVLRINHVAVAVTGESPFYRIVELEFRTEEAMQNGLNSEIGQTMAQDFGSFASGGVTVLLCHSQTTSLT